MNKSNHRAVKLAIFYALALTAVCFADSPGSAKSLAKQVLAAPIPVAQEPPPTRLTWLSDLKAGMNEAQRKRRWILVDCYTQYCHWCKTMDADTYSDPNVARMLGNHFVWVRCDCDDPTSGEWVKNKYSPQGYPCILILDPSGNEKGRILGYKRPQEFVSLVAKIIRQ